MFKSRIGIYLETVSNKGTSMMDEKLIGSYLISKGMNDEDVNNFFNRNLCDDFSDIQWENALKILEHLEVYDFFRLILPGYIAQPENHMKLCNKYGLGESERCLQTFYIKHLFNPRNKINDNQRRQLYRCYSKLIREKGLQKLPAKAFADLFDSINLFPLNPNWFVEDKTFQVKPQVREVLTLLSDTLQLPIDIRYKVCQEIYAGYKGAEVALENPKVKFSGLDDDEYRRTLIKLRNSLLKEASPLDVLNAIAITKKTVNGGGSTLPNDVMLECGIIWNLYASLLERGIGAESNLIIGTDSFLIKKITQSKLLEKVPFTFVVKSSREKELLELHFHNPDYSGNIREEYRFLTVEAFMELVKEEGIDYKNCLILASHVIQYIEQIYALFKKNQMPEQQLMILDGDLGFQNFIRKYESLGLHTMEAILLPTGIINSAEPKQKVLWTVSCQSQDEEETQIYEAQLVKSTEKNQQMCLPLNPIITLDAKTLTPLPAGRLRSALKKLKNEGVAKQKRNSARSVFFSPEIEIWYTTSKQGGRIRVATYICEEIKNRGIEIGRKSIENSRKHKLCGSEEEAELYAKNEYPFALVKNRTTGESFEIRRIISEHILQRYENREEHYLRPIHAKTLWYVYPDYENQLSKRGKETLRALMYSPVGEIEITQADFEDYMRVLQFNYPDDSYNTFAYKINLLSQLLDFALKKGFLYKNVISEEDDYENQYLQKFKHIRSGLTKKSFTHAEMKQLIYLINERIQAGEKEYIAALIKLDTGLENNIVAALTWKDFRYVLNYDFWQILVYRQMTNDGLEYRSLKSENDYRCIPCNKTLAAQLNTLRKEVKQKYPEDYEKHYIVTDITDNPVAPARLAQMCKRLIMDLGIREDLIEVPDYDKGTKEIDLNKYLGDIFRSNFKFWAVKESNFTADELQYLLGNVRTTTIGCHYCDFLHDGIQFRMFTKKNKIYIALENGRLQEDKRKKRGKMNE